MYVIVALYKNTIQDGGITALKTDFTVDTVDHVYMVYTVGAVDTVFTVDTACTVRGTEK